MMRHCGTYPPAVIFTPPSMNHCRVSYTVYRISTDLTSLSDSFTSCW